MIHAPYNFVPLSQWVYRPQWGHLVSHDLPFKDGVSGVLHYTLTTHTPLLVGDEQLRQGNGSSEVPFFTLPDGHNAIPGSSIKGMLRNVLEIAAFARMQLVDDTPQGLRDISGRHVKESYHQAMFGKDRNNPRGPRAGFLRRSKAGGPELIPCQFTRVSHFDLEEKINPHLTETLRMGLQRRCPHLFCQGDSVAEKYGLWRRYAQLVDGFPDDYVDLPPILFDHGHMATTNPRREETGAVNLGKGTIQGWLVFTGQISHRDQFADGEYKKGRKYKDFVFYDPAANPLPNEAIDDRVWRAFKWIHGDDGKPRKRVETTSKGKRSFQGKSPWLDYWKERYFKGERVPVFFRLEETTQRVQSLGLAYMYKVACDQSVGDVIRSTGDYGARGGHLDLPELLFGMAADGQESPLSLRGRISFSLLRQTSGETRTVPQEPTILNGPKPSYFPNYLVQNVEGDGSRIAAWAQYKTYMDDDAAIRGWKRYPVRPLEQARVQPLTPDQRNNHKIQVLLHTLPEGVVFQGKVRFHNLKPEELGALLWAMTWGGNDQLRHALGMGRPFGFGQVSMHLDRELADTVMPNDPQCGVLSAQEYIKAFAAEMDRAFAAEMDCFHTPKDSARRRWRDSPQIKQLLAMADPGQAIDKDLTHMRLEWRQNEFQQAKQGGYVLPPYRPMDASDLGTVGNAPANPSAKQAADVRSQCSWVDETIQAIMDASHSPLPLVLRGKSLAEKWRDIPDPALKEQALKEITRRWNEMGLWEGQSGKSWKTARSIYRGEE